MATNFYTDAEIDPVLRQLARLWMEKIRHAHDHKRKVFQDTADECMQFLVGTPWLVA
jgi:hypothetical protein